jgi:hypothetical protein
LNLLIYSERGEGVLRAILSRARTRGLASAELAGLPSHPPGQSPLRLPCCCPWDPASDQRLVRQHDNKEHMNRQPDDRILARFINQPTPHHPPTPSLSAKEHGLVCLSRHQGNSAGHSRHLLGRKLRTPSLPTKLHKLEHAQILEVSAFCKVKRRTFPSRR